MTSVPLHSTSLSSYKRHKKRQFHTEAMTNSHSFSLHVSDGIHSEAVEETKDYIVHNTKNLKNFFEERIPKNDLGVVGQKQETLMPSQIFRLKKEQQARKKGTNYSLKHSFKVERYPKRVHIKKLNETFHATGLTQSFSPKRNNIEINHRTHNYRTATQSSFRKHCTLIKKKAYIDVFGDDSNLKINHKLNENNYKNSNTNQNSQQIFKRVNNKSTKQQQQQRNHKQFSILLNKLNKYREQFANKLIPTHSHPDKDMKQTEQDTNPENQSMLGMPEMVNWIKKISVDYQNKSMSIMNEGKFVGNCGGIEDIQKVYPDYYQKLKSHKRDRLKLRRMFVNDFTGWDDCQSYAMPQRRQLGQDLRIDLVQKVHHEFESNLLTITDRGNEAFQEQLSPSNSHHIKFDPLTTPHDKFINFTNNLIYSIRQLQLYGIDKQHIYQALWKSKKPFQIQGSYAFFKHIKLGNVEVVKKFVQRNQSYVYEIDHENRSTLIYAVQNKHLHIVRYLLEIGLNTDHIAASKRNALYYALQRNQLEIVRDLLRSGANPWSTISCPVRILLKNCRKQIQIAIKNARKINLAMRLVKDPRKKVDLWVENRDKINSETVIEFS